MDKMKAWQGSIAVSYLEGIVSPDFMVLEFKIKPVVSDFFHYALRSPTKVAQYRHLPNGARKLAVAGVPQAADGRHRNG